LFISIGQQGGGKPEWGYLVSLFFGSRAAENFEEKRHKSMKSLRKIDF